MVPIEQEGLIRAFLCVPISLSLIIANDYSHSASYCILRIVRRLSCHGAAWLSLWCGVAQLVARRLAVRQARVRCPPRHHREVFPHWADKQWGNGERPQPTAMDKCIEWMWLSEWMYVCYKKYMKNKRKEWHHATKPLSCETHSRMWP
jgi:hypothetical protein